MIVKAQLATRIGEIIKGRKWSRQQEADVRGISEAKMLDCLAWP